MKNLLVTCFLFLAITSEANAQITLQHTYNTRTIFRVSLTLAGYKFASYQADSNRINLYNLNHSVYKTISIPQYAGVYSNVVYITDQLFDLDSKIEYALIYSDSSNTSLGHIRIYNEDGVLLFDRDSLGYVYGGAASNPEFYGLIASTDSGSFMVIHPVNNTSEVYSVPGKVPCDECNNGVFNVVSDPGYNVSGGKIGSAYPDPANSNTKIDYQLPPGVNEGEMIFYNLNGAEVKRIKVTNAFSTLLLSTQDLSPGSYYYILHASGFNSEGKKMIVIR